MRKHFLLAAALGLSTAALAQPAVPAPTSGKVKIKTKPGHHAAPADAPATADAAPTDWSLPYAATITPDALKADLSVLASDAYEGRETGAKGQKMAADYIAKAFAADGLAGPVKDSDNPYIQHFTMNRVSVDPATSVVIKGKTYVLGKDFYALADGKYAKAAPVTPTFVGYGIGAEGYSDYAAAGNLKGKDLVMLLGEPLTKAGKPLLAKGDEPSPYGTPGMGELMGRVPSLRTAQPASVFMIEPTAAAFAEVPKLMSQIFGEEQMEFADAKPQRGQNLFVVSPEMGAALLGTTPAGLARYGQSVAAAGKPVASPFKPATATVHAVKKREPFTTENVLGYLEGSDKKDEIVVISAHYDHLGIKNGVVFNGADDDGSGTVSVLAMARAFTQAKKDGHGPRRSLLFLANVGEEEGLLGSQYYTDHPIFPLENTVTDLNIDMVGRVDKEHEGKGDYVYLVGDDKLSSELHTLSEATNQQYNPVALDYKYNDPADPEHIYYRSDHYNFAKHKVPVIFYTSGLHPDYHKETDDVDKIDFPAMARRDQLVFHTAWALAQRDARVVVDSAKP
ncbi:M28 family peptidase [Hymenobacter baengnokdamensis]|uniref:M28 family peptidase n=1 Tax=Hymenobacter baengnokdamensis TaxID=2615203 RepID=UPI001245BEB3|nr:M28 family peptidase [Hymenobacter baengnokdamensis]